MVVYGSGFSGGDVTLPPSKSAAHRALICGALSGGSSKIYQIDHSKDMEATLGAVSSLGVKVSYSEKEKSVSLDAAGFGKVSSGEIDCLESGSTLRFLIPIAAALGGEWRFVGRGRLPQRPLEVYESLLPEHGVSYAAHSPHAELPLTISGKLTPGKFAVPGHISSQFITGLLFALPLLEGDNEIVLTSPLESEGYVELTLSILRDFGIRIERLPQGWKIPGRQFYKVRSYTVEGDWSQAAFFLAMAALSPTGAPVRLHGLEKNSMQGDRACIERFQAFGLEIGWKDDVLVARNPRAHLPFGGLTGCSFDVSQIPDMVPALAACAAFACGETRMTGARRLRLKESDRLAAMESALNVLGGQVSSTEDSLLLQGVEKAQGGIASGQNDHRIVMALAAAALRCEGPLSVTDEHSIQKSYPGFFEDFKKLGGSARVVHVG